MDKLLVDRGLAASRERAHALVLAGKVLINEQKIEKPGASVDSAAAVRILGVEQKYVSRGGVKLEKALQHWNIDLRGLACMDVGASTGGFTDCMLQSGAASVLAVDTGYGQIASRLRDDPRVRLLERTNARYLAAREIGGRIDFAAVDVSFISATLVLPAVVEAAAPREIVILVKPQFEVGRKLVGKGGIVRDPGSHRMAVEKVESSVLALGGRQIEVIESPILGGEGNREFLLHAIFDKN